MKYFLVGIVFGVLLLLLFINLGLDSNADQPVSFNHKKHVAQGLQCDACHRTFKTETFSGLPGIQVCLDCHKDPVTKSPEEEKIRQLHKKGQEIPWKKIAAQPDHVFFSHRRHVVLGKIACETCHGKVGEMEAPPSKPWVQMTMDWCMSCHTKTKTTNDCLACHV